MDEKRKIVDLTGNREEKIAPKNPDNGGNPQNKPGQGKSRRNHKKKFNNHNKDRAEKNGNQTEKTESNAPDKKPNHKKRGRNRGRKMPVQEQKVPAGTENTEDVIETVESETEDISSVTVYTHDPVEEPYDDSMHDEDESDTESKEVPETDAGEQFEVVGIRFRGAGKVYYFSPNGIEFAEGDHAIVETVRGMEFGDVSCGNKKVSGKEVVQPLKPVTRKATDADLKHFQSNCELEESAKPVFLEKAEKNKLDMQLVDVEYTFDNTKLCFYFTAEGRVDFRELVKDLAGVFRTRIELRQIGVRDEARLYGGLGVCGRPFCCKAFLPDFTQVSIKMAKEQNLSLASAKISGTCGRLMCCLKFEEDVYEEENKKMPQPETEIDTPRGKGIVLESSFLSQKVKVKMADDSSIRSFTMDELNGKESEPKKKPEEKKESFRKNKEDRKGSADQEAGTGEPENQVEESTSKNPSNDKNGNHPRRFNRPHKRKPPKQQK